MSEPSDAERERDAVSDDPRVGLESDVDGHGTPGRFIEDALIEAHHLANLTGLDEAKLARKRLVSAQSATREAKVRDLLHDAIEFLELARMERRDAMACKCMSGQNPS